MLPEVFPGLLFAVMWLGASKKRAFDAIEREVLSVVYVDGTPRVKQIKVMKYWISLMHSGNDQWDIYFRDKESFDVAKALLSDPLIPSLVKFGACSLPDVDCTIGDAIPF